jgi:predicted nuclease with RNAse H fold
MVTVGVDLAAEAARTAVAWLDWSAGRARLVRVEAGADDALIVEAVMGADKAGIDCPLGWPDRFVDFVTAHRAGDVQVPAGLAGRAWRRDLALRVTDQVVHEQTGLTPLSVSADRIGHATMRCAALLAELARRGRPVDRRGGGAVVEVYPAACLKRWGLPYRGYKRAANLIELGRLVDRLLEAAPWLGPGAYEPLCRASDDAADAVVSALAARASALGLVTTPAPGEQASAAATEGWIALPTTPLDRLVLDE